MEEAATPHSDEIRRVVARWTSAVERGDLDGVLAQHTPDVVMFDVPPPLQVVGLDGYRKMWERFLSYQPRGRFELSELQVIAGDTTAYCHGLLRIGEEPHPAVRLTLGLRKVDRRWLIAHEHHSAPYGS